MPVSKRAQIGAWESGRFIGAIIFAWGANPNLATAFGLKMTECSELVRVALTDHVNPVSRIVAIACKMIKRQAPGLRLLVSYADTRENHHGGIYQAAGWIYTGQTAEKFDYMLGDQLLQRRSYTGVNYGSPRLKLPAGSVKVKSPAKHRYVYVLDKSDRALVDRVESMRQQYPKRAPRGAGEIDNAADTNPQTGCASPTAPLLEGVAHGTP